MSYGHWQEAFFETSRGKVATQLRLGPRTVVDLARTLGLSDNAVRSHLHALERDGFVRPRGQRKGEGAGKPAALYELTPDADARFSTACVPLFSATLDALADVLPAEKLEEVIRAIGRRVVASAPVPPGVDPLEHAASVLEGLGALVDLSRTNGTRVLQGHGCPASMLVRGHPEVCRVVQAVLEEFTGKTVVETCERGERPSCRFEIRG